MKKKPRIPPAAQTLEPASSANTPAESPFGTWQCVAGEMTEEEGRAMAEDIWTLLHPQKASESSLMDFDHIVGVHLGRQPELVHLRISPERANYIFSREWHPTERVESREDGSLDYFVTIAPCWQIKRWIFGLTGRVEVIAPKGLRALVYDNCRQILEMYERTDEVKDED